MRALLIAFTFLAFAASPALAGPEIPFAERTALLGADRKCGLFEPGLRNALAAGAAQARGALLRSGWSEARTDDLARRAQTEGAGLSCSDPRVAQAANAARASFTAWTHLGAMRFPGGERSWLARRTPDPDGMMLRQDISAPLSAYFGVSWDPTGPALVFCLPIPDRASAPSGARLYMRDRTRAPRSAADLPGRTRTGLAALAASHGSAAVVWAAERRIVTRGKQSVAQLRFPAEAAASIAKLDPREAIEIEIDRPQGTVRFLIEVGDFDAARAFIAT